MESEEEDPGPAHPEIEPGDELEKNLEAFMADYLAEEACREGLEDLGSAPAPTANSSATVVDQVAEASMPEANMNANANTTTGDTGAVPEESTSRSAEVPHEGAEASMPEANNTTTGAVPEESTSQSAEVPANMVATTVSQGLGGSGSLNAQAHPEAETIPATIEAEAENNEEVSNSKPDAFVENATTQTASGHGSAHASMAGATPAMATVNDTEKEKENDIGMKSEDPSMADATPAMQHGQLEQVLEHVRTLGVELERPEHGGEGHENGESEGETDDEIIPDDAFKLRSEAVPDDVELFKLHMAFLEKEIQEAPFKSLSQTEEFKTWFDKSQQWEESSYSYCRGIRQHHLFAQFLESRNKPGKKGKKKNLDVTKMEPMSDFLLGDWVQFLQQPSFEAEEKTEMAALFELCQLHPCYHGYEQEQLTNDSSPETSKLVGGFFSWLSAKGKRHEAALRKCASAMLRNFGRSERGVQAARGEVHELEQHQYPDPPTQGHPDINKILPSVAEVGGV